MFIDEFLTLFKNQIPLDDIKHKLSYKEALTLRNVRVERLERERKENKGFDMGELEDLM